MREVRVYVNKNPYPVGSFFCWEMYREIFRRVVEVFEPCDATFVEEECVGSVKLECCGELECETAHEEVK